MEYSNYQLAIFDAIKNNSENLITNAVAGSGKTTTQIESLNFISNDIPVFYTAFNKSIAETLTQKIQLGKFTNAIATNIHKIGFQILRKNVNCRNFKVDDKKYLELIKELLKANPNLKFKSEDNPKTNGLPTKFDFIRDFSKLVDLVRSNLINVEDIEELKNICEHYNLDFNSYGQFVFNNLESILEKGESEAFQGKIDFTDMLWLPSIYNWQLKTNHEIIFIDECQDLSIVQTRIILAVGNKNTRYVACGDPFQSIYGFAGADNNSFYNLKQTLNAKELPLSICYRCGCQIVYEASHLVPQIEYGQNNLIGKVDYKTKQWMLENINLNEAILSRKTAPLIKLAFKLLLIGKPVKIAGRSIGEGLLTLLKKLPLCDYKEFPEVLKEFKNKQLEKIKSDTAKQNLTDKCECLFAFWENCSSLAELKGKLSELFSDNINNFIQLSTIHRAKGLEWHSVYLLKESLPMQYPNQLLWQYQQELNLKYVGITRAKVCLYWIE